MDIAEALLNATTLLPLFLPVCLSLSSFNLLNNSTLMAQVKHAKLNTHIHLQPFQNTHVRCYEGLITLREQEEVLFCPAEVETMWRKDLHSIKTGQRRVKCLSLLPMMKACPDVTCWLFLLCLIGENQSQDHHSPRDCKGNKYLASLPSRQDMPGASVSFKANIQIFHMVQEPLICLGRGIGRI